MAPDDAEDTDMAELVTQLWARRQAAEPLASLFIPVVCFHRGPHRLAANRLVRHAQASLTPGADTPPHAGEDEHARLRYSPSQGKGGNVDQNPLLHPKALTLANKEEN